MSARRVEPLHSVRARRQEQLSDVFILNLKGRERRTLTSRTRGRKKKVCSLICVRFLKKLNKISSRCNVSLSCRFGAPVRGVGGDSRPQEFTGAGGCSGENQQRQMLVQVPHSAHDSTNRCLQTPPGTYIHFVPYLIVFTDLRSNVTSSQRST